VGNSWRERERDGSDVGNIWREREREMGVTWETFGEREIVLHFVLFRSANCWAGREVERKQEMPVIYWLRNPKRRNQMGVSRGKWKIMGK